MQVIKFNLNNTKIITSILILFLITFSNINALPNYNEKAIAQDYNFNSGEKEIHLLRVEHYLYMITDENVGEFNLIYSFPPDKSHQTPILLEIYNDTTAQIEDYRIENDIYTPNKLVNFTITGIKKNEIKFVHFTCWVLNENNNYNNLPLNVDIPKIDDLPEEIKIWIHPTEVVQSKNYLIKNTAKKLKGPGNNLIKFASDTANFIKEHRYFLFVLQLNLGVFFSQDAITTLMINGENVGRSHLACAILRSYNIPARVLLVNNDQGFWTQMHYMVEYYVPDYGWVLLDSTSGKTPYDTKKIVINRICYPDDENDTKIDYIFPTMKGEERWLWIDNNYVEPYYIDCEEGSKSQMFRENIIYADEFTSNYVFLFTESIFTQYQKYMSETLSGENLNHYLKAIDYQKLAVYTLSESNDFFEYLYLMDKAYDEYKQIDI